MRFKNFNARYKILAPIKILSRGDEQAFEDCQNILEHLKHSLNQNFSDQTISKNWALGKKHVFLSEGTRQHLEDLRNEKRNQAATTAQRIWRGYTVKKKWPNLRRNLQAQLVAQRSSRATRPRPQPISGTPPPEAMHNGNFVDKSRQQIPLTMPDEVIKSMPGLQDQNNSLGVDRCDFKIIQKTCSLFGLDLVSTYNRFMA